MFNQKPEWQARVDLPLLQGLLDIKVGINVGNSHRTTNGSNHKRIVFSEPRREKEHVQRKMQDDTTHVGV
jgi:hypothetical protein